MLSEFYYGSSWRWPLSYLPRVMLSYNMLRKIRTPWRVDIPFMMDSGAFAVILKYGKYPYSPEEYASGIEKWHPDIVWTMDYPCEPSVQKRGDYNPGKAQEMTIDNQIRLLDLNTNTQMVVQGWTISDYLENLDRIKDQGLLTERLGIGSVCRRGQNREIARIIRAIHNNVPSWVKTDVESELEFKESFRLRIHGGKEVTLFLWSFILFSEAHIQEVFFTRRADHGPTMKWVHEVLP